MRTWIKLLLIATLVLSSCKTKDALLKHTNKKESKTAKLSPPTINTANFSKLNVDIYNKENKYSSAASIKIVRDSIIQVSIQPMVGIEMARADFYKDQVVLINKMKGQYIATNYDFISSKLKTKIDYASLQALLLNELFIVGESDLVFDSLYSKFVQAPFPDGVLLKSKSSKALVPSEFMLNHNNKIYYTSISMPLRLLTCRYTDFTETDGIIFPNNYKLSIIEGPKKNSAEITVKAVSFNQPTKINELNLSNYEQVNTFEQLMP